MKKEIIINVFIITFVIIINSLSLNYTSVSVSEMNNKLRDLKEVSLKKEKNNEEIIEISKSIYEEWKIKEEVLSYYIEHNELEKVNTLMESFCSFFEADLNEDAIPEIDKCIYVLYHIQQKQEFTLRNIF